MTLLAFQSSPEVLLAELTDAAYQVALERGSNAPFVDLELGLWRALYKVLNEQIATPPVRDAQPKALAEPAYYFRPVTWPAQKRTEQSFAEVG